MLGSAPSIAPDPSPAPATHDALRPPRAPRLASLDVFRGITSAAMLLVNNPGSWSSVYPPLQHAEWNGWTPTDLIFPFFLFIVGVAMTFSLGHWLDRGTARATVFRKAVTRAALIFALGLLLQGLPYYQLAHIRLLGVLQRIALSYLLAAAIVLSTELRGQIVALVGLLLGYWTLMTVVPVPGIGRAVLEPNMNLANWLDLHLIGMNHLNQDTRTWDPEGVLSTMGATATVVCGVLAGRWIRSQRPGLVTSLGLTVAGGLAVVVGLIWNQAFPINKSVWTSSFVLLSGGVAALLLALIYWLVDVKGWRTGWTTPFLVFGTNSIAAYWLSSALAIVLDTIVVADPVAEHRVLKDYLYETFFASWLELTNASLLYAISYVLLWLGLLTILYRRRVFLRI